MIRSAVAIALPGVAPFELGVVCEVRLARADRLFAVPFPTSLPEDVLVRLDPADIAARRRREEAA